MSDHLLSVPNPPAGVPRRSPVRDGLILALVGVGASGLALTTLGLGLLSLPALALAAVASVALIVLRPGWLMVVIGALVFFPGKRTIFPYEILVVLLGFLTILDGIRRRDRSMLKFDKAELANLLFIAWALATVFWCTNLRIYGHGVRRLAMGAAGFFIAYRLARVVPRRVFELSLIAIAVGLGGSALAKYLHETSFLQRTVDRGTATDLGWGKSNTIATILLVLNPLVLDMAFRARSRVIRGLAWCSSGFTGFMQMIIASRAATILYFGALYTQLTIGRRRRIVPVLIVSAVVIGAVLSPSGQKLLSRFTDLKEMGAMVVRIWYAREAWRRTIEGFPIGIGLNQGFIHPDHLQTMGTHDYWLDISSELGVPGIVLWIAFLVTLWRRLQAVSRTPGWSWEGRALMIAFWMSFFHTIVEPTFQESHYQFVFFWTMGGYLGYHAIGATRESEERRWKGESPPGTAAAA